MKRINVVILAAGKGERMRSSRPKVMHELMGRPLIGHVIEAARSLRPLTIAVVLGHGREIVAPCVKAYGVESVLQKEQKGTAHAVLAAGRLIRGEDVLVLYGDVPLITSAGLRSFLRFSRSHGVITFMTTDVVDPSGYGRVVADKGEIRSIVEDKEASPEERRITTINTGICFIPAERFPLLKSIGNDNRKGEFYLTDICAVAQRRGITVREYRHPIPSEVLGINTRRELLEASETIRRRIVDRHLENGVTILDRSVYIEDTVTVGRDTIVYPNSHLMGKTSIGENAVIGPNVIIRDSKVGNNVSVEGFVVMEGATLADGVKVGPFSRIRPSTVLRGGVRVGNFVEVKNSLLSEGVQASHLAYIGDARVGRHVNIGAGAVTCNYHGRRKNRTVIGDNVFVGSNASLVAPVIIGRDATIAAGSTITEEVPEGALAIERTAQKHVKGYRRRKRCAE